MSLTPFVPPWLAALVLLLWMAGAPDIAYAQQTGIEGMVRDADDRSPLVGANIAVRAEGSPDIVRGTATNPDGTYSISGIDPGRYLVEFRFVGYQSQELPVTVEEGEMAELAVALKIQTASLDQVVVSASRRQEKILDAPASISVLQPDEIEATVSTSSVEVLRATPGVDMAQTGIDRREVVLRGFNEAFSGSAFVLTDYRQASVPSLGVNVHSIMPNMTVDVERVEVVRGPGSALYGPGVDSGVIHYFTKDPFNYPGTTVAVSGGSRQFFGGQFRHAGTFSDNWGYKVTGQYARAEDWELDINDRPDSLEISRYRVYQDLDDPALEGRSFDRIDTDGDGQADAARLRREDIYSKVNVNGLLQYQPGDNTTISLNGGYAELTGAVQSGIGTLQAEGFGYYYGQLRVQSGGLFAQSYINVNDGGPDTYVYGGGNLVRDQSVQYNNQIQYDFSASSISTQVIIGADSDITVPRTNSQIVGRNEDDDLIQEYGAYTQTTTDLSEKFALTLAARADYNNVVEEVQLSPRVALVYKATPTNTLRGSYNRSFSSPGTNSLFLDVEAQRQPLPGGFDLVFRGLGAADGYTFDNFRQSNEIKYSFPVQGFFGLNLDVNNLPLLPYYAAVAQGSLNPQTGQFTQGVQQQLSGAGLTSQQIGLLGSLFGYMAQEPNRLGFFGGRTVNENGEAVVFGIPDASAQGYSVVDGPVDIAPIEQTTTQTFEVGYKGIVSDRLIVQIDGYYETKKDFVGPLVIESPLAYLQAQGLTADVAGELDEIFGTTSDGTVQSLLNDLANSGLAPGDVADLLGGVVGNGLGDTPTGIIQPDQEVLPGGGAGNEVGGFLSYRNFGEVSYYGTDISVTLQATDAFAIFANTSFLSDDFFDNEELDETNTSLSLALNAPAFKFKSGFDYRFDNGFSFGMTGNYVEGFPVETGPYVGSVDSYFLLDARMGYKVQSIPGLRVDVTGKNILNNEHREFAGAPELGLAVFGRMQYSF
ncbi:TonB-dependent receptor [Longibacter salinarum]|uniref:TonB-dependent receptor n=1 Tax=Longibacter salinarum TaxID=1850348 RepID=UPI0015CF2AE9|nr:TonB-dependent receptor [Longibacter salinarum]